MRIITHEEILNMKISPKCCYDWVSEVIRKKQQYVLPHKISLKYQNDGFYNTMPSILQEEGYFGVKIVNRYSDREPSLDSKLMLYNPESGELVALMDANFITAMRTGAVAVHSINHLGKSDVKNLGVIGLGNTARAAIKILAEVNKDNNYLIKLLKYKNQHELFAKELSVYPNLKFEYRDSYEEVIKDSDVVISAATYFEEDIADDTGHVAHFKNFSKFKKFGEVSDVVNHIIPGRENEQERILAYNIGISLHDVYFASKIYEQYQGGTEVTMNHPEGKFWV